MIGGERGVRLTEMEERGERQALRRSRALDWLPGIGIGRIDRPRRFAPSSQLVFEFKGVATANVRVSDRPVNLRNVPNVEGGAFRSGAMLTTSIPPIVDNRDAVSIVSQV